MNKCFCHFNGYEVKDAKARNDIETINSEITVFVGDSYGAMSTNNWCNEYSNINGLTIGENAFNFCVGGAGFLDVNNGTNTFLENLKRKENVISNKLLVKKIICCGGYNDRGQNKSTLEPEIENFINYCKENYPNAKIYIGMIGNSGLIDDTAGNITLRNYIITEILKSYKTCMKYGAIYLDGIENIMHYYGYFQEDLIHPNDEGCEELGKGIHQAVMSGSYKFTLDKEYTGITINSTNYELDSSINGSNTAISVSGFIENNVLHLKPIGNIYFSDYLHITKEDYSKEIILTNYDTSQKWFRNVNHLSNISILLKASLYNDEDTIIIPATIKFNKNGTISLNLVNNSNKANYYITRLYVIGSEQSIPLLCM